MLTALAATIRWGLFCGAPSFRLWLSRSEYGRGEGVLPVL